MSSLTSFPDTFSDNQAATGPMQWLLNLPTRAKLIFGFGLMLLLLLGVIIAAYFGITTLRNSVHDLYQTEFSSAIALGKLRSNQNAIRANLLTVLEIESAQTAPLLSEVQELTQENEELISTLLGDTQLQPDLRAKLEELIDLQAAFQRTREQEVIPLLTAGNMNDARGLMLGVQETRNQQMHALTEDLVAAFDQRAAQAVEEADQQAGFLIVLFLVAGIVALLASMGLTLLLERMIANALKVITAVAERVGSGDLSVNLQAMYRADEVGRLAHMFRRMIEALRELNREVHDGVSVLSSSTNEIVATTTQLATGTAETAAAVNQTTTTVEEVRQVAEVASQKAKNVLDSAQKSVQIAQAGTKSVEETVQGMHRIQEQMELISASIVRLSEQSQAIGEIIASVTDLAEQSNLLAVNAAIEAAKAGEHGRGFAVVAQEVRSLAVQSKQATAQVRAILNDIQTATSSAVMATEQGSRAVEAGVNQSREAGEAIRLLTNVITEATQASTQIAASSQQQLVGMIQVAQAMENINQAGAQNAASTRQAETIAQDLNALAQRLKHLVEQYNL